MLDSLSDLKILEYADRIDDILNFESRLDLDVMSKSMGMIKKDMNASIELLSV